MTPLMVALFAAATGANANTVSTATRIRWAGALGWKITTYCGYCATAPLATKGDETVVLTGPS